MTDNDIPPSYKQLAKDLLRRIIDNVSIEIDLQAPTT